MISLENYSSGNKVNQSIADIVYHTLFEAEKFAQFYPKNQENLTANDNYFEMIIETE